MLRSKLAACTLAFVVLATSMISVNSQNSVGDKPAKGGGRTRSAVRAMNGMVATSQPLASAAGASPLSRWQRARACRPSHQCQGCCVARAISSAACARAHSWAATSVATSGSGCGGNTSMGRSRIVGRRRCGACPRAAGCGPLESVFPLAGCRAAGEGHRGQSQQFSCQAFP